MALIDDLHQRMTDIDMQLNDHTLPDIKVRCLIKRKNNLFSEINFLETRKAVTANTYPIKFNPNN